MALSSNTINWTTLPKETIRSDHQIGVIGLPLRWRTNKWIHNPAKSYKLLHDIIAGNDYNQKTYKIRKKTVLTKKKFHNFYTLSTLLGTPNGARAYHSRISKRAEDFINLETASKVDKEAWLSQYRHQDGKIIIPARPFLVNNLLELKSGNSNAKDVDGLIYKIFANQLNKFMLINDRFHWNLVWNSIQKYQENTYNIKNFAKKKDQEGEKSLKNCRILSNIPVRCKLKEAYLIAQIGQKLADETIKHHPDSHGFLPKRGVETLMLKLATKSI